jgi:hypothetical protein
MKKLSLLAILLCIVVCCFADNPTSGKNDGNIQCPFYQSYIELSASLAGPVLSGGAAIDVVNGCRIHKNVYLGGGVGVHSLFAGHDAVPYFEMVASPIFADFRALFPIPSSKITPYIETAVGPLLLYHFYIEGTGKMPYSTLAYFKLGIGIDIIDRFSIGAGYELWGAGYELLGGNINMGCIKLGMRIGKDKGKL